MRLRVEKAEHTGEASSSAEGGIGARETWRGRGAAAVRGRAAAWRGRGRSAHLHFLPLPILGLVEGLCEAVVVVIDVPADAAARLRADVVRIVLDPAATARRGGCGTVNDGMARHAWRGNK